MCGKEKPCILVVDDSAPSRDGIALLLRDEGYDTCEAATAGEAINILDERCIRGETCPDLVILDIDLPDVKGGTLARWTKAVYPDIAMILVTAYGRLPAFEEIARSLGIPFETKPIEVEKFLPLVAGELRDYKNRRRVGKQTVAVPPVMREHIAEVAEERRGRGA